MRAALMMQVAANATVAGRRYRPSIATFAVEHQCFGGRDFSFSRMNWVKPNFLWMMYRSSWGTAEGQRYVLALRIKRAVFDGWLESAVPSSFPKGDALLDIEDISAFVADQRGRSEIDLVTPSEREYPLSACAKKRLRVT